MAINSINSNIAAFYAQTNIGSASSAVSVSVARLSSGNRIVRASDDVAGLSIGTSLRTNVSTLKIAKLNTALGSSLLQVADGALAQIVEILQRQLAIATQAGSGSLTSTERSFLDQEFQALSSEIDRLVAQTNFNGVKLLDGTLSERVGLTGNDKQATQAAATLTFSDNPDNNETVVVNGVTITFVTSGATGLQVNIGATTAQSVAALATKLNNAETDSAFSSAQKLLVSKASFSSQGNTLQITSRSGGELGENFRIDLSGTAVDTAAEAGIGGEYGGAYYTVFSTGFASATSIIAATAAADATPFQIGDNITATIGGTGFTLYTVAAGDTLQSIVNGINANATSTGVRAELTFTNEQTYNIRLEYDDPRNAVTFSGGANYDDDTYAVNYAGNAYFTVFDTGFSSATTDLVGTSSTAALPFEVGDDLTAVLTGGTTLTLHTFTQTDTLTDIVAGINANTGTTGVAAQLVSSGGAFNIRLSYLTPNSQTATVSAGANFDSTNQGINAAATTTFNGPMQLQRVYGLTQGGADGIGFGTTAVSGSVGNDILTGLVQTKAKVVMSFPEIASADLSSTANFGNSSGVYITVGGHNFVFSTTTGTGKANDEITIGSSLEETLDNAVATINAYVGVGSEEFQLNQVKVYRDGRNLVFESRDVANVTTLSNATSTVSISNMTTVSTTNSGNLNNSDTGGVVVSGISNSAFIGAISGFKAIYKSSDSIDLSIKIGNYTYTAQNVDSTPTSDTTIRLFSETLADGTNGGYFDVELKANKGETITAQPAANTFAARLDAAFGTLSFYQKRNVASYTGNSAVVTDGTVTGSLVGSRVDVQLKDFNDVKIDSINVTAPQGSNPNGLIEISVNGERFITSPSLGSKLGANQTYRLTSVVDANKFIEFTTGSSTIDFATDAKSASFEQALKDAFGVGDGSAQLAFQVGASTADTLKIGINDVSTDAIYGGQPLNVLTQTGAQVASDSIAKAIKTVTSVRADVGALQSRFNYAAANIESTIQNQDAARGELLDTDIASESTSFAVSQVKLQAGISTLAQANQQLQSLLKLIG